MYRIMLMLLLFLFSMSIHTNAKIDSIVIEPIFHVGPVLIEKGNPLQLKVDYELEDQQLFVECQLNGFLFNPEAVGTLHQENEGHIRVYVDHEHVATVFEPVFYIQNLPKGDHEVKIQVVQNDHTPYEGLEEIFSITVA